MLWVGLQCVIVVFPDHTHLLFWPYIDWLYFSSRLSRLRPYHDSNNFSAQFIKIISRYKKIGYNINVLQQTACLVVNPITVGNFAFLFNCTPVSWTSDSMTVPT